MRRRHVEGEPQPPSKTELKRQAQALQQLGEQLIDAPDALLDSLHLPEKLGDAIRLARSITSRAALARQKQYVGKLMRQIDTEPIVAALEAEHAGRSLAARRFHRVERWRDRLLAGGEPVLAALAEECPQAVTPELRQLLAVARDDARPAERSRAAKRLFRLLAGSLEGG